MCPRACRACPALNTLLENGKAALWLIVLAPRCRAVYTGETKAPASARVASRPVEEPLQGTRKRARIDPFVPGGSSRQVFLAEPQRKDKVAPVEAMWCEDVDGQPVPLHQADVVSAPPHAGFSMRQRGQISSASGAMPLKATQGLVS